MTNSSTITSYGQSTKWRAIEVISNETGQNVTQYFKYNLDRNAITVSNSTMNADFSIQLPDPNNPNTVKINRINLSLLDVLSITKYNTTTSGIPYTIYHSVYSNIPITIGNTTYNRLDVSVHMPKD
jgi:hypothetical protein